MKRGMPLSTPQFDDPEANESRRTLEASPNANNVPAQASNPIMSPLAGGIGPMAAVQRHQNSNTC